MCEPNCNEKKLEFIYNAMNDARDTIRALDNKVSYIFAAIGIVFALIGIVFNKILEVYKHFKGTPAISGVIFISLIIYIGATIFSAFFGYKTLNPKVNPDNHLHLDGIVPHKLWYLISDNKNNVIMPLTDYCQKINDLTIEDLITTISYELMKLSYIRNIKLKYSKININCFMISVVAFSIVLLIAFVYYFIYTV